MREVLLHLPRPHWNSGKEMRDAYGNHEVDIIPEDLEIVQITHKTSFHHHGIRHLFTATLYKIYHTSRHASILFPSQKYSQQAQDIYTQGINVKRPSYDLPFYFTMACQLNISHDYPPKERTGRYQSKNFFVRKLEHLGIGVCRSQPRSGGWGPAVLDT